VNIAAFVATAATTEPQIFAVYSLPQIIHNITVWVVGLLVGVATLFATVGALRIVAAGGDPTEYELAS
jgi:hypothetical protein